nr:helix-turn-helix domain-containing protein [uncultured Flavobacterium sp.]
MDEQLKLLNKKELCVLMGVSIGKIDTLIRKNQIKYLKIGKNVRFKENDIRTYLNKNYN